MLIKDLKINMKTTTDERYLWLEDIVNRVEYDETLNEKSLVLMGETFFDKDLSLVDVKKFSEWLNSHGGVNFLIQDIHSLSNRLLNQEEKSIYKDIGKLDHVTLFLTTDETGVSASDVKEGFVFNWIGQNDFRQLTKELENKEVVANKLEDYNRLREEHSEDIVGVLIEEVLNETVDNDKKASILDLSVDALLRW